MEQDNMGHLGKAWWDYVEIRKSLGQTQKDAQCRNKWRWNIEAAGHPWSTWKKWHREWIISLTK